MRYWNHTHQNSCELSKTGNIIWCLELSKAEKHYNIENRI